MCAVAERRSSVCDGRDVGEREGKVKRVAGEPFPRCDVQSQMIGVSMATSSPAEIELSISTEQACFLIVKARQFEVKDVQTVSDPASNAADDGMRDVLEDRPGDPVVQEIHDFIQALDEDSQIDLVALAWIGRGDFDVSDWQEARDLAAREHNTRTAEYLLGMPLLSEFLEDALSDLGRNCEDEEAQHL